MSVTSRDAAVLSTALAATATTVAVLHRIDGVSPTTVALALLLIVLVTATLGRLWIATVVAIGATLAFNYFFFHPVGTFTIADPQNWIAVIAFLIAAVIASHLSTAAQSRAHEAIARRNEVIRLFELTRDVLLSTEPEGALDALAGHVARRFELSRVALCLPKEDGWHLHQGGSDEVHVDDATLNAALAKADGAPDAGGNSRDYAADARASEQRGELRIVPLRHGSKPVGLLAVAGHSLDPGTLDAIAGVVAVAIERTQLLRERQTAEFARQKAELASTLLASLSHDLRTPLTAIRVAVENLRTGLAEGERRSQAHAALAELDRLTRLFQNILEMARIETAAVEVDREWVNPADIVDAAVARVRQALEGRVRLRLDAESDVLVEIDPRVASMALSHLLENACQYSPAGAEIAIEAVADPEGLRVHVTDRGPGLDPGELEHLFERFYRGRDARRHSPGTGMGLAISRGLLAALGGRVWAENASDGGARFTMVVPGQRRPVAVKT